MRLKEPLYGIRTAQMMSVIHCTLGIMMIFVERRAILDGEKLEAHAAAHHSSTQHPTPSSHLQIDDQHINFLGLQDTVTMIDV